MPDLGLYSGPLLEERQAKPDVPPAVIGDYVLPVSHINFREIHHLLLQAFMLRATSRPASLEPLSRSASLEPLSRSASTGSSG